MVKGQNYKDGWSPLTSSEEYTDVNLNCLFNGQKTSHFFFCLQNVTIMAFCKIIDALIILNPPKTSCQRHLYD